jgi:RHS repeat-associated protein
LRPCRISAKSSGTAPTNCADASNLGNIVDFSYNFDSDPAAGVQNNGNVGAIANNITPGRGQLFSYDELNRIKTAQTQATSGQYCWGETFEYDIWANLKTIGPITSTHNGCTQESGLSVSITNLNRISGHSYDAAGNLTSAPGMGSYTWDAESRMKATAGVTYTYDGDGRRVKKSNGKLYWYGLGLDVLLETDAAGNTPDEYIFFGGKRIARRQSAGAVSYYFSDHLGTSRVVTNATGTLLDDSDFYPFGGERVVVNNDPNQYKFTGKERDTESALDYFSARYYSSAQGRFLSPDEFTGGPVDVFLMGSGDGELQALPYASVTEPQSLNKYSYGFNNPLRYYDPDGHAEQDSQQAVDQEKDEKARAGAQGAAAASSQVGIQEGKVRKAYNKAKEGMKNITPEQRDALKQAARQKSTPLGKAVAEAAGSSSSRQAAIEAKKTAGTLAESAGRTNPAWNKAGQAVGAAGRVVAIVTIAESAYNISTAEGDKGRVAAGEAGAIAGGIAGGFAGAKTGALIGAVGGPKGSAIGAGVGFVVGAIGGGMSTKKAAQEVYDSVSSKPE